MQALKNNPAVDPHAILHEQLALERLKRAGLAPPEPPIELDPWYARLLRGLKVFAVFGEKERWNHKVEFPREWR